LHDSHVKGVSQHFEAKSSLLFEHVSKWPPLYENVSKERSPQSIPTKVPPMDALEVARFLDQPCMCLTPLS